MPRGSADLCDRPNAIANRFKPGVASNPAGRNQYSYRKDFEVSIGKLLAGKLSPEFAHFIPEELRDLINYLKPETTGEALAILQIAGSLKLDEKMLPESLKRVWPTVERHEVTGLDGAAVEVECAGAWDDFAGSLAGLASRSSNPEPPGTDAEREEGDYPQ